MTDEERHRLKVFEARVRTLIMKYNALEQENEKLHEDLTLQEETICRLEAEVSQAKEDYKRLKTARMIEVSDTDVRQARNTITRLVREVNRCIGLLSSDND